MRQLSSDGLETPTCADALATAAGSVVLREARHPERTSAGRPQVARDLRPQGVRRQVPRRREWAFGSEEFTIRRMATILVIADDTRMLDLHHEVLTRRA